MNTQRNRKRSNNRIIAYVAAGLVHAVIIGAVLFNFNSDPKPVDAAYAEKVDIVKANTVDESQIQKYQDDIAKKEREKKREKEQALEKLKELKDQSIAEEKRIEELKEQQVREADKAAELEAERKAIALKKKKEDEKREKEKVERKKKEKAEKEKKRKREEEAKEKKRKRDAKEKREKELERQALEKQKNDAERRLQESLAAEESFQADLRAKERATTLQAKYTALITQQVNRYRIIAPDFERWLTATTNVKLSPSGEVLSVRTVKSSGNVRYDRSVETAIYKASPLPIPSVAEDPGVNEQFRNLNLYFDMSGV